MRNKGDKWKKIELRMISGQHVVKQQGKVVRHVFPSDYFCEEIQEVYRWTGMTTPVLLLDLPIYNSYDQFPYFRAYLWSHLLVYVTTNLQSQYISQQCFLSFGYTSVLMPKD